MQIFCFIALEVRSLKWISLGEIRMSVGYILSGERPFFTFFSFWRLLHLLALGPFLASLQPFAPTFTPPTTDWLSLLLPITTFGVTGVWNNLENLPISRWLQLITSTKSLLPHEVSKSQVSWLRCRCLWKGASLAYHILLVRRACDYLKALETVPGTKHPQMWFVTLGAFPTWSKAWPSPAWIIPVIFPEASLLLSLPLPILGTAAKVIYLKHESACFSPLLKIQHSLFPFYSTLWVASAAYPCAPPNSTYLNKHFSLAPAT